MIEINIGYDNNETILVEKTFDANIDSLREYFQDYSIEKLDFKVINPALIDIRTNMLFEYKNDALPLALMAADVRNEKSCLFKEMTKLFNSGDIVQDKINMLRYLVGYYIKCIFNESERRNDGKHVLYAFRYCGYYAFKASIPKYLSGEYNFCFNFSDMSTEELSNYIIPCYYREIGWWDRECVRNNKELMESLSESWMKRARSGSLD